MGQKVNPISNRLGVIRGWDSNWSEKGKYPANILEDYKLREYLNVRLAKCSVSRVVIERTLKMITITVCTSRPGLIIGQGGKDVEALKKELSKITDKDVQINVHEVKRPELDAQIVASTIARQVEGKVAYRRAVKASRFRFPAVSTALKSPAAKCSRKAALPCTLSAPTSTTLSSRPTPKLVFSV